MRSIFDEVELDHLHLKNRFVRSATWEALAAPNGGPSEAQVQIYDELAKGGVGTIITGFTSVVSDDNYIDGMARLSSDSLIPAYRKLTEAVHRQNCNTLVQLALGDYRRNGKVVEADSANTDDLQNLILLFSEAARRASEAGFDGVQLHAAHNFWLSCFISPAYNHRTDLYGGTQENRTLLLAEIMDAVRKAAPDLHISMKINCSDFMDDGLTFDNALTSCLYMAKAGIDSIEISGNGTSASGIKPGVNEAYYLPFAKRLKAQSNVPVMLVGGHRSIENMEKIINETEIELLSISRPLLREPDLINRWKSGNHSPSKCVSCNLCYQTPGHKCIYVLREHKN